MLSHNKNMKKKYKEFLIMLSIFMLFLFRNSINEILIILSKNFDFSNACSYTCEDAMQENKALKEIVEFKDSVNYDYVISRVKYRDVLDFTDEFQIFKGRNDNLEEGMAVINDKGLIGTIKTVDKSISKVELISNKNSNISVRINNVYGILKYEDNKLIVSNITNYSEINIGDKIYTSGIGNLPGEIYVGTVKNINLSNLGIEQIVLVDAAVDFNNISYLMIVRPS